MSDTKEKRNFRMDKKILFDIIFRQAGTLSKAILEGAMNAIDAGASMFDVTIKPKQVVLIDDGKGFKSKKEIEDWFEVFGTPHEESESKRFAQFRMGRGQLFAYGRNDWYTGVFHMDVDVKNEGLDYVLDQRPKNKAVTGCRITVDLYEELLPSDVADAERDLADWLKWAGLHDIAVTVNGTQVSNDPRDEQFAGRWTEVTDEAYIRLTQGGSLSLYNLGVHTMDYPGYKFGCGGEVVSRKQLKVNFARNDVQSSCTIWRKIRPLINQRATDDNKSRKSLDDDGRKRMADQLVRGELPDSYETSKLKLITAVTGRHFPMNDLWNLRGFQFVTNAPKGSRVGDKLMRTQIAFVVADETLERFGVATVPELLDVLQKQLFNTDYQIEHRPDYKPFDAMTAHLSSKYSVLPEDKLTVDEKIWLRLINGHGGLLRPSYLDEGEHVYGYYGSRKVVIGEADAADGWTDADSFVAINRKFLRELDLDVAGIADVSLLLIHEACHQDPDMEEHDHDQAFYELYHDTTVACQAEFVDAVLKGMPLAMKNEGKKANRKTLKTLDKVAEVQQQASEIDTLAARE